MTALEVECNAVRILIFENFNFIAILILIEENIAQLHPSTWIWSTAL